MQSKLDILFIKSNTFKNIKGRHAINILPLNIYNRVRIRSDL